MEEYIISINGKPRFRCPSRVDAEMTMTALSYGRRFDPVETKLLSARANLALAEMKLRKLLGGDGE